MWYGPKNAKRAIVAMGSGVKSCIDVMNWQNKLTPEDPVGILDVKL